MKLYRKNLRNWSNWLIQTTLQDKLILILLNSWFARNTTDIKNSHDLQRSIEKIRYIKRVMLFTLATAITVARILLDKLEDADLRIALLVIVFGITAVAIMRLSFSQCYLFKFKKDYEDVFDILDMVPENGINSNTTRKQLNVIADDLMTEYATKYITNKDSFGENHEITKHSARHMIEKGRLLRRFGLSKGDTREYFREAESRLARR